MPTKIDAAVGNPLIVDTADASATEAEKIEAAMMYMRRIADDLLRAQAGHFAAVLTAGDQARALSAITEGPIGVAAWRRVCAERRAKLG